MLPTTKDLAKAASVSLATVDRVLNGRAGVRKETVDAVNTAIKKIGFERNQIAATLARKRGYRFGFVLPNKKDEFIKEILNSIHQVNSDLRVQMVQIIVISVDDHNPHKLAEALSKISLKNFDGIAIMAPESPQIRDAIKRLQERGINIIPFISNQEGIEESDFVGINNHAAGSTAGRLMCRFLCRKTGSIAVINDTLQAKYSIERRLGFDEIVSKFSPNLTILPSIETFGDNERTHLILKTMLSANINLQGIYIISSEARSSLEAIEQYSLDRELIVLAHERTQSTISALKSGNLAAIITQDTGLLVRTALHVLRGKYENRSAAISQEKVRIEILIAENLHLSQ
ncbi:MAG TPA: LacI family DNA-binding transcriptional regulator [Candidatus Thioglobus sp.]|nr:LacI family DNA-binding transcriptional regulator [Candidatus Thioglobus sp.]